MEVSISAYIETLFPWDLVIEVGGKAYATRPLTLGDMAVLEAIEAGRVHDLAKIADVVKSLFVDPKPDVMRWTTEELMSVMAEITRYQQAQSKKNAERIAQNAKAKAERTESRSTPGK